MFSTDHNVYYLTSINIVMYLVRASVNDRSFSNIHWKLSILIYYYSRVNWDSRLSYHTIHTPRNKYCQTYICFLMYTHLSRLFNISFIYVHFVAKSFQTCKIEASQISKCRLGAVNQMLYLEV